MIKISEKNSSVINIEFHSPDYDTFCEIKETMREHKATFNKTTKLWELPIIKYREIFGALDGLDSIESTVSNASLTKAEDGGEKEIRIERVKRIPDYSLMKYPPMVGKHPNENFQAEAIEKGINRNRYAYFFEMGTGKSYIAASIIAHRLDKYHDVSKVVFLTTSIGVRNLKHELTKFIKGLDPKRVSIASKDNRYPFTPDKDIVIMSYNSFRLVCEAHCKDYFKKQLGELQKIYKDYEEQRASLPYDIAMAKAELNKKKGDVALEKKLLKLLDTKDNIDDRFEKKFNPLRDSLIRNLQNAYVPVDVSYKHDPAKIIRALSIACNKTRSYSKNTKTPILPLSEWADGKELMLVLDESHEVMYNTSGRGAMVALHAPLFKYRYLFTGTPADQPEKLYNQFRILDPWLVYNLTFAQWKDKMAIIGNRFSQSAIVSWRKDELERSNERFIKLHGNYLRTIDAVELPEYNEKKIYLDMTPEHREIYQRCVTEDLMFWNNASTQDIINRFPYMMMSIDYPHLLEKHRYKTQHSIMKDEWGDTVTDDKGRKVFEDESEKFISDELYELIKNFDDANLEKLNALEDIIEDHKGEKVIVWATHPATIKAVCTRFKKLNPIGIDGSVPEEDKEIKVGENKGTVVLGRNTLVERFKTDPNCKLLVANIQCLNTSVTITEATVSVYLERGFSYAPYAQSQRRNYRIGQQNDVVSYVLIYENSLDVMVDKNLDSKGMLIKGLVGKDFLSQEEWIKIFNASAEDAL